MSDHIRSDHQTIRPDLAEGLLQLPRLPGLSLEPLPEVSLCAVGELRSEEVQYMHEKQTERWIENEDLTF